MDLHYFADGGTYSLELIDIHETKVEMCLASSRFTQVIPKEEADLPETAELLESLKQIRIYVGAIHPYEEGAEEVGYRTELESRILKRLQEFVERNPQFHEELSCFISTSQLERKFKVVCE